MDFIPAELYSQCVANLPITTVDVVVVAPDNSVLLCKRLNEPARGLLYTPGGRQFKNEKLHQAAERILRTELGIVQIPELQYIGVIDEMFDVSAFAGISAHCTNIYFGCRLSKETPLVLDSQHSEYGWFKPNDPTLHPYVQEKINKTIDFLGAL